jgi:hypothetical protein
MAKIKFNTKLGDFPYSPRFAADTKSEDFA